MHVSSVFDDRLTIKDSLSLRHHFVFAIKVM